MEDKKHPNLDVKIRFQLWKIRNIRIWMKTNTFQIWMSNYVLIVEDKKHLHLDENKYILVYNYEHTNVMSKLHSNFGRQETSKFECKQT